MIYRHLDAKKKHLLDVEEVYNLSPFLSPTWLPPRPILSHCRGGSLTKPMSITAFDTNLTLMSSRAS